MASLEPCLDLVPSGSDSHVEPCGTRLFGSPCLRDPGDWPSNAAGDPLTFLGQLRLESVAGQLFFPTSLPRRGLLSLFYDLENAPDGTRIDDRFGFRLLWIPEPSTCLPVDPPRGDAATHRAPFHLAQVPRWRLPSEVDSGYFLGSLSEEEFEAYETLRSSIAPPREHGLLGPGEWLQGDARILAAVAASKLWPGSGSSVRDWRLLWQVGGDAGLSELLGDESRLHVLIRDEDLSACRFLRAWVVLERG